MHGSYNRRPLGIDQAAAGVHFFTPIIARFRTNVRKKIAACPLVRRASPIVIKFTHLAGDEFSMV